MRLVKSSIATRIYSCLVLPWNVCMDTIRNYVRLMINWHISYFLESNIVLLSLISCWGHPSFRECCTIHLLLLMKRQDCGVKYLTISCSRISVQTFLIPLSLLPFSELLLASAGFEKPNLPSPLGYL